VVLTTNHKDFDVDYIQQHAKLIVDLRNMVKEKSEKVVKL
jgi:UDP-N-acetyl-D-glucosamine dehydrogenase